MTITAFNNTFPYLHYRAGPPGASLVQRLFGLEVQAPCPPDFQEPGAAPPPEDKGAGSGSGKQRVAPSRQSPQVRLCTSSERQIGCCVSLAPASLCSTGFGWLSQDDVWCSLNT